MVRVAASLEHLDPADKVLLGKWIAQRMKNPETAAGPWAWALGRLGSRVPLYGSSHKTVARSKPASLALTAVGRAAGGASMARPLPSRSWRA